MSDQRKRNLALIAGVLAISLVAASIAGAHELTAAAQTQPTQTEDKPTVTTLGSATVKVDPDKVSVNIGVETKGPTAAEAARENARVMEQVLSALRGLGIRTDQIATSNYGVFPVYELVSPPCIMEGKVMTEVYPPPPECQPRNEITGYMASNTVTVTVDASFDVGSVIDAAVDAGATNVSGAYFFVSDERQQEIRDSLIEKAVANAQSRAEKAAGAVGMKVTGVKSINLNDVYFPVFRMSLADASEFSSTQILPGQQSVSMTVQVVFTMG